MESGSVESRALYWIRVGVGKVNWSGSEGIGVGVFPLRGLSTNNKLTHVANPQMTPVPRDLPSSDVPQSLEFIVNEIDLRDSMSVLDPAVSQPILVV